MIEAEGKRESDFGRAAWTRLLTVGVLPAAMAGLTLALARLDAGWEPAAQVAGICRELIAGTTEGRQALFGSCWIAPLPTLFYLPFAWLLPEPLAGDGAFFSACLFLFWAVRGSVKATGRSAGRIMVAQVAVGAVLATGSRSSALQVATALTSGLALLTGTGLADWAAWRRLRDLVFAGAAGALLLLCGFAAMGPALLAVAVLPLAACGHRETRVRAQAWALLGWLPLIYAAGVWMLLNRLVLGDSLFFLRSLGRLAIFSQASLWDALAPIAALSVALAITWVQDARSSEPGAGRVAASSFLVAFAVALLLWGRLLTRCGVGWDAAMLHRCMVIILLAAVSRLRLPAVGLALPVAVCVWLGRWGDEPVERRGAEREAGTREAIRREVEAYVTARTPYGRIFATGYTGLDLLRGYEGDRMTANLDLHLATLRQAYRGQTLFILVPEPVGVARAESIFWRFPDIYEMGAERLLYAGTFGSWRLFEVVTAPTQEQLDAWRRRD